MAYTDMMMVIARIFKCFFLIFIRFIMMSNIDLIKSVGFIPISHVSIHVGAHTNAEITPITRLSEKDHHIIRRGEGRSRCTAGCSVIH